MLKQFPFISSNFAKKCLIVVVLSKHYPPSLSSQSWSWLCGSWIYNYLCNQSLSPLTLWVRIQLIAMCTRYNIMW